MVLAARTSGKAGLAPRSQARDIRRMNIGQFSSRFALLSGFALTVESASPRSLQAQDTSVVYPAAIESRKGMVACSSDIACDAGARVLAKGGNAVDAVVATAFAMAVTYPAAGNLGGGGFMVVSATRGVTTFDFRERAPLKATPTMYLDSAGNIDRKLTATGYLAPGVPGTVRGLEMAHRKYGRLPWKDVVAPAIALAKGFALSDALARSLNREVARNMEPYPASVAAYGKPGGGVWVAGDTIRLLDLARSLEAIAAGGADAFYRGWIADSIAADMARSGGLISKADLAAYAAKERAPVRGTYRGYVVYSMPPPSSGGIALVEMLNLLEKKNLRVADRWSPRTLHLTIEAMRRAFHDRARYLGDPDFVTVPAAQLVSKAYATSLARQIDSTHATSSVSLAPNLMGIADAESEETTHISVVDASGMGVSLTYTLEGGFGSHVVARGTGILLNNEMGDFNKKPGFTSLTGDIGTPANVIAPGKRMLSSMTPTIVKKDGSLFLVTGSPGGRTIINTVFNVVLNTLEYDMDVRAAVDAPRYHHQWLPDSVMFEEQAIPDSTFARLQAIGHAARMRGGQGDAHTIRYDARTRKTYGANDFRSRDSKVSVP
jgi:gamma-glutamyltranspeptidase/glutathione hydrolase